MNNEKKIDLERPNLKYRDEYALQVYEHISNGYSISSFNVTPTVAQTTVFQWLKDHEAFALAVARGRSEFLMRLETALMHITFGVPLTEKQKAWMPKVNLKALTFTLSRRYRQEYGKDFDPNGKTLEDQTRVTKITFIEMPGRSPRKTDLGESDKPDIVVESIEV